jgi:hypothetical protein
MKQGLNSSEACRIVGLGRKTGSHWRNGRTVWDPTTGRIRTYPAITVVREQTAGISSRSLSEVVRITIADRQPRSWEGSIHCQPLTAPEPTSGIPSSLRAEESVDPAVRPRVGKKRGPSRPQGLCAGDAGPGGGTPAGRQLRNAFPGRQDPHIVHETIYQGLYIQGRRRPSRELVQLLRTGSGANPTGPLPGRADDHWPRSGSQQPRGPRAWGRRP